MSPTRRQVLAGLGSTGLAYALVGCSTAGEPAVEEAGEQTPRRDAVRAVRGRPNRPGIDARDWLIVSAAGTVTAYTSRTEIGQGLTTILYELVSQGLELPRDRVEVVLGDTDTCPPDGPTTGSAATRYIAWAFWIACHEIKEDLLVLAAQALEIDVTELEYDAGEIFVRTDPARRVAIAELADGQVRRVRVDPENNPIELPEYVDRGAANVNAEAIVTGTLEYTADHYPDGCLYGGYISPAYHESQTRLVFSNFGAARELPGVVRVKPLDKGVIALGETYGAVQRAIEIMDANWHEPERPRELDVEAEVRAGAELQWTVEEKGNVDLALDSSTTVVKETYVTQFMTQVPLETDTAIARKVDGRIEVRLGTQNPFYVRSKIALQEGVEEDQVRVIAAPTGGAFGSKSDHVVGEEAAYMLQLTDRPVKYVYSRRDDIQRRGRFKEAVVFDVETGIDGYGRSIARKIDIYQDEGHGTREMYDLPNSLTRLYQAPLPVKHATMRGTSFVQSVFALESHTDMVAAALGEDRLDYRRANVDLDAFVPLIDACAEALDHGRYQPPDDNGVGFAICNHGGRQLGAVGAEVAVDRTSGVVTVERLFGAFDIGVVINRRLAVNGIKGSMIWGIGAALFENVELDGHRCFTTGFSDYRIARMSDTPPIEVVFLDNQNPGQPRGCGEVPVPPTTAAIANAVYDAIGVRFYSLPITPEKVLAALAEA